MKKALFLLLVLSACGERPQLITTRHSVVLPEESMYQCQRFSNFPSGNITSNQASRMIVELVQTNEVCYSSQQALRQFLESARTRIETGQTPAAQPTPQPSSPAPTTGARFRRMNQ